MSTYYINMRIWRWWGMVCVCVCACVGSFGARQPWTWILALQFYYCVTLMSTASLTVSPNEMVKTMKPTMALWGIHLFYHLFFCFPYVSRLRSRQKKLMDFQNTPFGGIFSEQSNGVRINVASLCSLHRHWVGSQGSQRAIDSLLSPLLGLSSPVEWESSPRLLF